MEAIPIQSHPLTSPNEGGIKVGMEQGHYIEMKKQVGEALRSQADQFDKAILTLAAGALALSLTFIKEIAPTPDGLTIGLLALSWGCFIGSVCLTLLSCHTSVCAYRRFDQILNIQQSKPDTDASSLKNCWVTVTLVLNLSSLVVFVVGTVLLSCSAYHGLKIKEQNVSDQKSTRLTEGAIPVSPPVAQEGQRGAVPPSPPVAKPGEHGAVPPLPPVTAPQPPVPQPPLPSTKK
jgi:hypothetical protein